MRLRTLSTCAVLVALVLTTFPLTEHAGAGTVAVHRKWKMFRLVNDARLNRGMPRLEMCRPLAHDAKRHSTRMARQNRLFHSDLGSLDLCRRADLLGENVGYAGTVKRAFRMFMRSPAHRENILRQRYDHIGVGVIAGHGRLWVTLDFYSHA